MVRITRFSIDETEYPDFMHHPALAADQWDDEEEIDFVPSQSLQMFENSNDRDGDRSNLNSDESQTRNHNPQQPDR